MSAAPPLSAAELAVVARFDAAPVLPESSAIVRAVLALAEELDDRAAVVDRGAEGHWDRGRAWELAGAAAAIRTTVASVLAADPEPREAVVERRVELVWHDGWGYRCPRCKVFVALPQREAAAYCPRCVVTHPGITGEAEDRLRAALQPRLDEDDADWVIQLIAAEIDRLAAAALDARGGTQ